MKPPISIKVHVLSPFGYEVRTWTVGNEITPEQYLRHCDSQTGDLFVLAGYEAGNEQMDLLDINHWLEAKRQMDNSQLS